MNTEAPKFLIESIEHRGEGELHRTWWGPNRMGYTIDLNRAGRYSSEEAANILGGANLVDIHERGWLESEVLAGEAGSMRIQSLDGETVHVVTFRHDQSPGQRESEYLTWWHGAQEEIARLRVALGGIAVLENLAMNLLASSTYETDPIVQSKRQGSSNAYLEVAKMAKKALEVRK